MANFLVVLDSNIERRDKFIKSVKPGMSPVDGLVPGECCQGNVHVLWSADPSAPVSQIVDDAGVSVLWGNPTKQGHPEQLNAAELRSLWVDPDDRQRSALNGFFAGIVCHPDVGLVVGCDLLGVFPVYYYSGSDFLLVGSSPELFSKHPAFKAEFNPAGLVGILLTMHCFAGNTLFKGVKRLAAGHLLVKAPETPATEQLHYRLPVSTDYFSLPFSAHVELLDRSLTSQSETRLSGADKRSFMLSGGLDSRLLAGYLGQNGGDVVALTLGVPDDIEMKCAGGVARELKFEHHGIDIPFSGYSSYADLQVRWEHLSSGFNNCMEWGIYPHLRRHGQRVIMGHMLDAVIGTRYINWAYSAESESMSFENFFAHANGWGLSPGTLKRLLRRDVFGDLVDETLESIKHVYEGYSEHESQRAWCFNLHHRQRFHVGSSAWATSFGAWPIVPALDDQLLSYAGGMPASTIAERRAQVELLCERFPQLAALPLDRNSYHTRPLRPRLRYQLGQALKKNWAPLLHRHKGEERRYYVRIFDINGAGWQAIRLEAEESRDLLATFFNRDVLDRLLPGPGNRIELENEIIDASGLKTLLGLMIWSKRYL